MSELQIIELVSALVLLSLASLGELYLIRKLFRNAEEDRHIIFILAKDKVKKEMGGMVENFHKGLENLFNPKDNHNDKNRKKTNDKNKHQN